MNTLISEKYHRIHNYLALVRIPSIFSAMSNVWAGFFIAGGKDALSLASGLIASSFFIMAGMALNDVADRIEDAAERPDRPIPSKKIKPRNASLFAIGLIAIGLVLVFRIKTSAVVVAGLLCYCIYLYNFILKKGKFGPLVMAFCRVLNFSLGLLLGLGTSSLFDFYNLKTFFASLSLGLYIYLLTYLARDETRGNTRERATAFMLGLMLWGGMWLGYFLSSSWEIEKWTGLLCLAFLTYFIMGPLSKFFKDPSASHTGKLVGVMLGCIPLLDILSMLLHNTKTLYALVPVLFLILAKRTAKLFYVT